MFDWLKHKATFRQLGFTSDCHCHLLPGVDDGVKSFEESVEALRRMHAMGIGSAVLTPHVNPDIFPGNTEDFLRSRFSEFVAALPDDIRSSMLLTLGAEYMVTPGFEDRDTSELLQFQPGKVLIEMSYLFPSGNMEQTLFALSMAGLRPVIAHPERYLYYADKLEKFERFHDMGAEFQMNLLSLGGAYGKGSMRILRFLHEKGWYAYRGTDAHGAGTLEDISGMRFSAELL
ncbi:MAG: hypothetical protein MJY89_00245 [Bacteroidales bacterium]|nr:hypothetical protein [Bacteroidales bacterium]